MCLHASSMPTAETLYPATATSRSIRGLTYSASAAVFVLNSMAVKVNVKWGKELYKDVEVDLSQPPLIFKSQLFTLSGVPPDRQKVLIKGGQLKDDEWGKQQPKDGMTLMMMGSAEEVKVDAPANMPKFVEDLPEEEQNTLATKAYGSGLKNLGNTCYMNSTVQCLYSIQGLRDAVLDFSPSAAPAAPASTLAGPSTDSSKKLLLATQELFQDLKKGGESFPPFKFLLMLRQRFPQFAQQTNEGYYMQQDAEECWTNIMYTLKEGLKVRHSNTLLDQHTEVHAGEPCRKHSSQCLLMHQKGQPLS